jgi:hypothetical protein
MKTKGPRSRATSYTVKAVRAAEKSPAEAGLVDRSIKAGLLGLTVTPHSNRVTWENRRPSKPASERAAARLVSMSDVRQAGEASGA